MSPPPPPDERVFPGRPASPGLAVGVIELRTRHGARGAADPAPPPAGTPEQELAALDAALAAAAARLEALAAADAEGTGAEVLALQVALLEDAELLAPARAAALAGEPAAVAWAGALDAEIAGYRAAEDAYFRARAADLADLRDRVLGALAGSDGGAPAAAAAGAAGSILVADDLAPSRFLETDWTRCRGAALTGGSALGHAAMLARARGVPLVVGLEAEPGALADGVPAILDAEEGRLILAPSAATRARYDLRLAARRAEAEAQGRHLAEPAVTAGGERVRVMLNVDDPALLEAVDPAHCDGIGLTRTEFLFHGRTAGALPDEDEQYRAYRRLLAWAGDGRPVTVRTLDAGGDKPIPSLTPERDANPFLGVRGVRLSLARPEVFRVQLRALARAAARGDLRVMLPMVTVPAELEAARRLLVEAVEGLRAGGVEAAMPRLGMMVEVPAAALDIAAFGGADFYSIGSNDLVQYVMAAARDEPGVAALHDPLSPAVLELIRRVVAHGVAAGREVSLCGDMAADPAGLSALLDLGLRGVSVAPVALARTKAAIARWR